VISDGFLKLESLDFWMTPSPNEIVREKSGAKRGGKKRQKATTNLSLLSHPLLKFRRTLPLFVIEFVAIVAICRYMRRDFISL
jgi:hypothetical protein